MGFDFSGFVLRAPRSAPSNSPETAAPTNGVLRDLKPLPSGYFGAAPSLVDLAADQYRTAVLNGSPDGEDFLVWAANSSNLALGEGSSWSTTLGSVEIPQGTYSVLDPASPDNGQRADGTARLVVLDDGGRTLADVLSITAVRGDAPDVPFVLSPGTHFSVPDPESGVVNILDNIATQALLNPVSGEPASFSTLRGDTVTEVEFVVAAARFWWTKNTSETTRFGWNGKFQRWEPIKGSPPKNLGTLEVGTTYELVPRPASLVIGDYLPGSTLSDAYAMLRVGATPGALDSVPISENIAGAFTGALVQSDAAVSENFDFGSVGSPEPAAVVGVTNGVLQFNPAYIAEQVGQVLWYVFQPFEEGSTGLVGPLLGAGDTPLFITPIPGPTDRPFIRLGSRRPLLPTLVATEANLPGTVSEGAVVVALSTGRLKFSAIDVAKADPNDVGFQTPYLGANVSYIGVALNQLPQTTKDPVDLVGVGGTPITVGATAELFVPDAIPGPNQGISGVLHVPDGTGATPTTGVPGIRPGPTGLLRQVRGFGDVLLYGPSGAFENLVIVDTPTDAPDFDFQIPAGTAYIIRQRGTQGSLVRIGKADRNKFAGEQLSFLQAELSPSIYAGAARIISKQKEPFVFDGTEALYLAITVLPIQWDASDLSLSGGSFSAVDVAASIQAAITLAGSSGVAVARNGHVVIETVTPATGIVEIGFGNPKDLSACDVLGFLPGWNANASSGGLWLSDTGASLGLFRSPVNLDRTSGVADFKSTARLEDEILQGPVSQLPYVPLTQEPLQDVAGYDENVFFKLVEGLGSQTLGHLEEVLYQFDGGRFSWLDSHVESRAVDQPTSTLILGQTNVVPPTLSPSVNNGGLYVSGAGGGFQLQTLGEDYILPDNGAPGYALLVDQVQDLSLLGSRGVFSQGGTIFQDSNTSLDFSMVQEGYRLKILSGDAAGSYQVVSATISQVVVEQAFPAASTPGPPVPWEIYEGVASADYDPGLIADVKYQTFNHFPTEPFLILLLSNLGAVPLDASSQEAARLVATMSEALAKGREIVVRFGLEGSVENELVGLQLSELGTIANGSLFVPGVASDRYVDEAFAIQIGADLFEHGAGLESVGVFTGTPGTVEYLDSTGELGFADDLLTDYAEAGVVYQEQFLTPSVVPAGVTEFDPQTGDLNFSQADLDEYGSNQTSAVFVEQMITENQLDVAIAPLTGAIVFGTPLRAGQVVEVEYFQADSAGDVKLDDDGAPIQVREFLPRFIRGEEATRVDSQKYTFNPTGKTPDLQVEATVYVLPDLQNYGGINQAVVTLATNTIDFTYSIPEGETVTIGYAVYEAFGGEGAYSVSTPPVFRKPFFLEKDQSTFTLRSDRSGDMLPGKVLRVSSALFYVKASSYDAATDTTSVEIWPPPFNETGSRSPGNDAASFLTDLQVATVVDPDGTPVVVPEASAGLFQLLLTTFEPMDRGSLEFRFGGDLTDLAAPNRVLEIDGTPFLISGSKFDNTTQITVVSITAPTSRSFDPSTAVSKISVRPIYPPSPTQFTGLGSVQATEPFELVLFGEQDSLGTELPGRTLVPNVEYLLDLDTGDITLLEPFQRPLGPGESLFLKYTRVGILAPLLSGGVVLLPRYFARFMFVTTPSEENGYLGKTLEATYTFQSPDTFYWRTLPIPELLQEVSDGITQSVQNQNPHSGAVLASVQQPSDSDQGRVGLIASRQGLIDTDRAARIYIEFYNQVVLGFEQIVETIDGRVIGDRDGKFRFFVGRGKEESAPGYENAITGELTPRNVWAEVFRNATLGVAGGPYVFEEDDYVIEPLTSSIVADKLDGRFPSSQRLDSLISEQSSFIKNDIDDIVLIGTGPARAVLLSFFKIDLKAKGLFQNLALPSALSRIYPQTARTFTTMFPGVGADLDAGDPGVYTFGRTVTGENGPERASTFRGAIGTISNPVLGTIPNVTSVLPRERLAAARVWAYSPTGFPGLDSILGTTFGATPRPAIIASMVPFSDFPVDVETGFPDFAQFVSQGGDVKDILSGDYDLSRPPWRPFADAPTDPSQVGFGHPDGTVFDVGFAGILLDVNGKSRLGGVYVDEVFGGAVVTLRSDSGAILGGTQILIPGDPPLTGPILELTQGDTVQVVDQTGTDTQTASPPTNEELAELTRNLPNFRVGFDVGVNRTDGEYLDLTYPSFEDPTWLGLKEMFGQKPPEPMSTMEAFVRFSNGEIHPLRMPALLGQSFDDDGDQAIPYLSATNTEMDRLGNIQSNLALVKTTDTSIPTAQYPDEHLGEDGEILAAAVGSDPPATLVTQTDLTPVGAYVPHSGIGNLTSYDLLLTETGNAALVDGSQGILTVGAVTGGAPSYIEPPRFVTQSKGGDLCKYVFAGAMAHVDPTGLTGVVALEAGGDTFLDIGFGGAAVPNLVWNDGQPGLLGGLNNLIQFTNSNRLEIYMVDKTTGLVLETLTIQGTTVQGGAGSGVLTTSVTFSPNTLRIPFLTGIIDFTGTGLGSDPSPPMNFYVVLQVLSSTGSTNAYVGPDRLSFFEDVDLRSVQPRGTKIAGVYDVEGKLGVYEITSPLGGLSVNDPTSVNAGAQFTFLARPSIGGFGVGTFTPATGSGAGDELGSVKVMGWEGDANTPVTSTGATFSAVPSTIFDDVGLICDGEADLDETIDNEARSISLLAGGLDRIQEGDLFVVDRAEGAGPLATAKAGTYLVRHAVADTLSSVDEKLRTATGGTFLVVNLVEDVVPSSLTITATIGGSPSLATDDGVTPIGAITGPDIAAGTIIYATGAINVTYSTAPDIGTPITATYSTNSRVSYLNARAGSPGWVEAEFPTLVEFNATANSLEVSDLFTVPQSPSGKGFPDSGTRRVYIIRDQAALTDADPAVARLSVVSAAYSTLVGSTLFGGITDWQDADGNSISEAVFESLISVGMPISGMLFFNVRVRDASLPDNNVVGTDVFGMSKSGLREFFIANDDTGGTLSFLETAIKVDGGAIPSNVFFKTGALPTPGAYVADRYAAVYSDVLTYLDFSDLLQIQWDFIHNLSGNTGAVGCLLPGESLRSTFLPLEGIYLEPSFPTSVFDLTSGAAHVVDATHNLLPAEVGFRASGLGPERVHFTCRRIRRWHAIQDNVSSDLEGLAFAYETRRGTITGVGTGPALPNQLQRLTASGSTQLGGFTDPDVNLNAGDLFRHVDSAGNLVQEVEIASIEDDTNLILAAPGLSGTPTGQAFEVYLRQAPVPHEQTNQQLFELVTDEVLFESSADLINQTGGFVDVFNTLKDTEVDGSPLTFGEGGLGVQPGDYIVVDPAGDLRGPAGFAVPPENGTRPFGDSSVSGRPSHIGGRPSDLDDNRGFYRIDTVNDNDNELVVTEASAFAGVSESAADDVVFGSPSKEYAVYPVVSASTLTAGTEGQQSLRPTNWVGQGNSFRVDTLGDPSPESVAPFSYKIIRPSPFFLQDSAELILMHRERILSWMEHLEKLTSGQKSGDYFVFQRDVHLSDLGTPLIPDEGLGLFSNAVIQGVLGLVDVSPFESDSDSLSVLDRRLWIGDFRLDSEVPPFGGVIPYADLQNGEGRPVLPDLIEDVLDRTDQFRGLRYAWIDFRANRANGTLLRIQIFDRGLPEALAEQKRLARLTKGS